ncbi:c-type cytochrome [Haliangium ochraceum]|uniref:Cytochrome c domain-containing protein n=1 Tax=Haliangium ochraceum (strain DSM 14365 / JCM 11303 / SMP-2) TaxID=502025 RepID=D0LP37_HALO1|nr:cytochrome c [Haliangium ochraceum]ACY18863.1 hypothetical protein Hoch_6394 [Haliangium ochraceum DSM 14365]
MHRISLGALILAALALLGWQGWADDQAAPAQTPRPGAPAAADDATAELGAQLYDRFCLACHGTYGDGQGPAADWLWPRPRDFTRGEYKWRSTPSGAPPLAADIAAAIRYGAPGTTMHGFGEWLSEGQVAALVVHLRGFAPEAFARAAEPVRIDAPPPLGPAELARGRELYAQLGCLACHGDEGRGDGPAAAALRDAEGAPAAPYDLARSALRRPRSPDTPAVAAIYASVLTGLSGTPMPGYAGAASAADLWAVAAFVDSLRAPAADAAASVAERAIPAAAIARDRENRDTYGGYWTGHGSELEQAVFGETIAVQGPPPSKLAPAQASLDAERCQRCHAKQVREWGGSIHANSTSPGVMAQIAYHKRNGSSLESCQRCHAPLAEQLPELRPGHGGGDDDSRDYLPNPRFDADLRAQGLNCAGCHLRSWTRLGPPRADGSKLLAAPGYPLAEAAIYERSDFCLGCHQLPPRLAVNGRPLLDTYREWLQGPYMKRGIQCQHCHMPNREHTWKGIHDPETFRQGIELDTIAARSNSTGAVSVRARVTNVGAGHYLPTTPTPAAWLRVELLDGEGEPIPGAHAEKRIGRDLEFKGGWIEREDTRIPPGQSLELAAAWKAGKVAQATSVRVRVRVVPDDYYERLYRRVLGSRKLAPDLRALYQQALDRAEAAHYVAVDRVVPIGTLAATAATR